jgi:hypothetical protein
VQLKEVAVRVPHRIAVSIALMLVCSEAMAEVTYLSCSGTMIRAVEPREPSPDWTLSLIVDTEKETITVEDYEPVQLSGGSKQVLVFMSANPTQDGVSTGTLNRISGKVSINIIDPTLGLLKYAGICKQAQKLF